MRRPTKLLSYADLRDRGVSFSKSHIDLLEKRGEFPRRVQLGTRRAGWVEEEIEAWLRERIARRDPVD